MQTNCVDNGPREGLRTFLEAASDDPDTVLHYEFMQARAHHRDFTYVVVDGSHLPLLLHLAIGIGFASKPSGVQQRVHRLRRAPDITLQFFHVRRTTGYTSSTPMAGLNMCRTSACPPASSTRSSRPRATAASITPTRLLTW